MKNTQYQLHLKGFVGGYDFDRDYVDYVLARNEGKPVHVLIDSLGGSLATAISIASAFKRHGDVTVHFVGMNATSSHFLNPYHFRLSRKPTFTSL